MTESLARFLVRAKTSSYASGREYAVLGDGTRRRTFEGEEFVYRDQYVGENPFVGQELVFRHSRPFWSMNYYGTVTSDRPSLEEVYAFLREALMNVDEAEPFRGPGAFTKGPLKYTCHTKGNVNNFNGSEAITHKGRKVYSLLFHGGLIERRPQDR